MSIWGGVGVEGGRGEREGRGEEGRGGERREGERGVRGEGGDGRGGRGGTEGREREGRGEEEGWGGRGGELVCAEGGGETREQSIHVIFAISQATLGPTECQFCTQHAITARSALTATNNGVTAVKAKRAWLARVRTVPRLTQ